MDLRREFEPIVYLPDSQTPNSEMESDAYMMVRSEQPPEVLVPEIRSRLLKVNPDLVLKFTQLKDDIVNSLVAERLMAMLAGFFGVLAIVLAVIGLYGVIAYMVTRRTNEIGIRMALGADRRRILMLIMREVAAICAIGLLVGLGLALAAAPAVRSLLFGLRPTDPSTLAVAIVGVILFTVLASLLPALRAAQLDPMAALHDE
ncbi:MAG: FtsX-like permease family protein [Candidatus Korobacteraceae bacterium]